MLKVWNVRLVSAHLRALHPRHVPDAERHRCRRSTRSSSRASAGGSSASSRSSLVLSTGLISARLPLLRARAPHGVARLARGDVPVQQPAVRRRSPSRCSGASLFPLVSRPCAASRSPSRSPFFNFFAVVFGLPLILLMGIGPADRLAAGVAAQPAARVRRAVPLGLAAAALLLVLGYGIEPRPGVAALSLCVFVAVTIVCEFARGTGRGARSMPATPGRGARVARGPQPAALRRLHRPPRLVRRGRSASSARRPTRPSTRPTLAPARRFSARLHA